jgi:hypothetical protein
VSIVRGTIGALLGAAGAAVALRVRSVMKERDETLAEVVGDLPGILAEDVSRLGDAARGALEDGRTASARARIEFDEQVARRARRTEGDDG